LIGSGDCNSISVVAVGVNCEPANDMSWPVSPKLHVGGHFLSAGGKLAGMKLQFSLATLLVCMTVLGVVTAISVALPVHQLVKANESAQIGFHNGKPVFAFWDTDHALVRSATGIDIAWRLALWGPLAVGSILGVLWAIRRLKSRRENRPSVG
jgi:hypothetical protein